MKDFAKFLAKDFRKKNIKTIKNKRIKAYVEHLQKHPGQYSTSYITTNMSAIRHYYRIVSEGKIRIKSNQELGVNPRTMTERCTGDKSMDNTDYLDLLSITQGNNQADYAQILKLGKVFGLRLRESFLLRK